jgi:hypothetical protein
VSGLRTEMQMIHTPRHMRTEMGELLTLSCLVKCAVLEMTMRSFLVLALDLPKVGILKHSLRAILLLPLL